MVERAVLPNFFLLGAGRSGSTTLHRMLRQHPDIFMSRMKEPSFFIKGFHVIDNAVDYADQFRDSAGHTAIGEASHVYLSHPDGAKTVHAFFPDVKFVVILRNPADRALSLYGWMTDNGYETAPSFERALELEETRLTDPAFARSAPWYFWNYTYFRSGLFGEQLQRYFERYDRDRFHFTTLRELSTDPAGTQEAIHRFLGVDPRPVEHQAANVTKGVRSPRLRFHQRQLTDFLDRRGWPGEERIDRFVSRINRGTRPSMKPETRAALLERYADDMALTNELIGIDTHDA